MKSSGWVPAPGQFLPLATGSFYGDSFVIALGKAQERGI
jgi:hypothetical protein